MKQDLSKVKVGDRIWTIQGGWVTVKHPSYIIKGHPIYTGLCSYTIDGKVNVSDKYPSAFLEYPFKEQPIEKDTLVWYRLSENESWRIGYYSHFEDGLHHCFTGSLKSTQTYETYSWNIVTTENPLT
jgi:hypothetical protein